MWSELIQAVAAAGRRRLVTSRVRATVTADSPSDCFIEIVDVYPRIYRPTIKALTIATFTLAIAVVLAENWLRPWVPAWIAHNPSAAAGLVFASFGLILLLPPDRPYRLTLQSDERALVIRGEFHLDGIDVDGVHLVPWADATVEVHDASLVLKTGEGSVIELAAGCRWLDGRDEVNGALRAARSAADESHRLPDLLTAAAPDDAVLPYRRPDEPDDIGITRTPFVVRLSIGHRPRHAGAAWLADLRFRLRRFRSLKGVSSDFTVPVGLPLAELAVTPFELWIVDRSSRIDETLRRIPRDRITAFRPNRYDDTLFLYVAGESQGNVELPTDRRALQRLVAEHLMPLLADRA